MKSIIRHHVANALLAIAATAAVMAGESESPSLDITWCTIDAGGGACSDGGNLQVHGTIGQPDGGHISMSGSLELVGGFWAGSIDPVDTCPADIAPPPLGDQTVNITDLLLVIAHWGGGAGDAADVNGDNVVNIADLLAVIADWGVCS